jgi:hypothetical protein
MSRTPPQRPWFWERHQWSQPTTPDVAYQRAGGRRRRNAEQQLAKAIRRNRLLGIMYDPANPLGFVQRGWQTRAARTLGVDRATVCRDLDALVGEIFGNGMDAGAEFGLQITCRFLRTLLPTPAEKRLRARLGLSDA